MPPVDSRFAAFLTSIEQSHLRTVAAILALAGAAGVCVALAVVMTERLRWGLSLGLLLAVPTFVLAIAACWRAGAKTLAVRFSIACVGILAFPIAEIAAYIPHARRIESVRAAAIDEGDRAAMRVYMATPRQSQAGLSKLAPVTTPYFTINEDGFRGRPLDASRLAAIRIAMAGGSAVFGTGVADAHTLPAALETLLRARDATAAVVNLGVEAITIRQEASIVAESIARISPTVMIFYDGANDFLLNGWLPATAGRRDLYQADTVSARLADRIRQSLVVTSLRRAIGATAGELPNGTAIVEAARTAYAAGRRQAEDVCRAARVRCVFVVQPIITDRNAPSYPEQIEIDARSIDFPDYGRLYRAYVAAMREEFPDTIDARAAVADDPRMMFLDWVHLTAAGNELVARHIADVAVAR